jgi:hypothetical protein
MSSNLKVNTIQPSSGDTVSIAGIASVTSSVSIASSCTATTFYGDGSNLTGVSGLSVGNQADNRLITCTGTTDTLYGESNLTFASNVLTLSGTLNVSGEVQIAENIVHSGDGNTAIGFPANDTIRCITAGSERLRINSSGDFGFNDASPTAHASGNNTVLSIKGKGSSYSGKIDFKDSSGNIDSYINSDNSILQFYCDPNSQNGNTAMTFSVHGSERARITSDGKVVAGGNGTGYPCRLQSHGAGDLLDLNSTSGAGKIRFYESGAGRFNIETLNGAAGIRFLDALNNVEAMRIHANGRITTPNQPMYSGMGYVGQGTQVQTSIYAIRPSAVYANLGSHFDTSTGVFTCPIAGRYLCIGAMGRRTTAFNWNGFYLIHNGATKGDMWFPPARDNGTNPASPAAFRADQFTYNPTNLSAVLTCAANDTISFAFHSSYAAPLNSSANYAQFILIG